MDSYESLPGPSRLVRDLSQADNYKLLTHSIGQNGQFRSLHNNDSAHEEVAAINTVEPSTLGHMVQGIDGDMYVVVDGDDGPNDGYEDSNDIHMMVTADEDRRSETSEYGEVDTFDDPNDNSYHRNSDVQVGAGDVIPHSLIMETIPQGLKNRKNRQYGNSRCPECGASFINTARLERHLAVHQVFGSFLCPLCGKTYKYEYNLFHHWRKTCRDLNELVDPTERQTMDVNQIRELVDEVAQKKSEIGPIDIGIGKSVLFQSGPQARLEMPATPSGRRGPACRACGVVVPSSHMPRHLSLHHGNAHPDQRTSTGGFFCDLCGLSFRHHYNLIKHWRTSCQEILANLPDNVELTLNDDQLKEMISDLLKKAVTNNDELLTNNLRDTGDVGNSGQMLKPEDMESTSKQFLTDENTPSSSSNYNDVVFADDFGDEEDFDINAPIPNNKAKWKVDGAGVQCPECFRSFANSGRLERHIAGFHSSFGSHHCILCGNRFKYDYNLLYHYRRSCQYTRTFIDRDVREQMDAASLRKVVRQLANKEVKLTPRVKPETMMMLNLRRHNLATKKETGRMAFSVPPPPQLLQPRPGVPDARPCPVCGIVFYGETAVTRHVDAMHSMAHSSYSTMDGDNDTVLDDNFIALEDEMTTDVPPVLVPEVVRESVEIEAMERSRVAIQFIEKNNRPITQLNENDAADIKRMISVGDLLVGYQMVLVDGDVEVNYTLLDIRLPPNEKDVMIIVLEPAVLET